MKTMIFILHAKKTNNIELREKSDIPIGDLQKTRDSEFPITFKTIRDMANDNLSALAGFSPLLVYPNEVRVTNSRSNSIRNSP